MSIESNIRAYAKRCAEKQVEPKPAQGHTPGPWRPFLRYVLANGRFMATAHTVGDEGESLGFEKGQEPTQDMNEAEANARLIAAAPDLLDALQGFVELDFTKAGMLEIAPVIDKAVAAIAKAEGRVQ